MVIALSTAFLAVEDIALVMAAARLGFDPGRVALYCGIGLGTVLIGGLVVYPGDTFLPVWWLGLVAVASGLTAGTALTRRARVAATLVTTLLALAGLGGFMFGR